MTKHPATATETTAGTDRDADQGAHSTPDAERPANRRTGKWRIENWDYARWAPPARPTQFRVRWEEEPWGVMRGIGFPTAVFPTWQAAMTYVNEQIRAERWAEMQRQTHTAGIHWDQHHRDPQHERGNLTKEAL